MASAVLTSHDSSWVQSGGGGSGYMGKIPYLNPNPNPNPKKKQKRFHNHHHPHAVANGRHNNDDAAPVTQTASDDAYSFNQRPIEPRNGRDGFNHGGYLTFNVASCTKTEINELRQRLVSELEQIQNLRDRIESGQLSTTNDSIPKSHGGKSSKKVAGNKRPVPFGSNKGPNYFSNEFDNRNVGLAAMGNMEGLMKECRQILTKLMKHKHGWVFNKPVDALALGLHDYHQIVKRPMDLGTVKSNFSKNLYSSPVEFAADVRLTFNNALLYNPKTDPVNGMADQLLERFEELFRPIHVKIDSFRREFHGGNALQGSSWNNIPAPERMKKTKASPVAPPPPPPQASLKKQERVQNQNHSSASTPSIPPPPAMSPPPPMRPHSPVHTQSPPKSQSPVKPQVTGRGSTTKLPKPRAKDLNKREMSMEEKHKLGVGLQSLPEEKMPQLMQIIRKRNDNLEQDSDEIELDIEALDTETLWELDRFVTNWKKLVSKTKRQALLMNLNPGNSAAPSTIAEDPEVGDAVSEKIDLAKKPKKGDVGEEDVDIDDDMPATSFPPVEIEKDEAGGVGHDNDDNGNASSSSSSSSSSGSDSSSSSDSDSGSSSGSDSDEDDAQS